MSVVLESGAGSASPGDPLVRHEWVLPALPHGDPAAVRAVAVALRELAWRVRAGQRAAEAVVADLRRAAWRGGAALSTHGPVEQLASSASRVASALESLATALDDYARKLAGAQRDHGWSWKKIAVVTGVVVVGAGLVVLTAGAGAPAAAVVGAEVATASAAASAAVAAEVTVAASLTQSLALVRGLHVLSRFVVPRLYVGAVQAPMWASTPLGGAAVGASTAAAMDYAETGSVDAGSVFFGALLGVAEGASTSGLRAAGRVPTAAELGYAFDRLAATRAARAKFVQWPREISFGDGKQLKTHYKHAPALGLPANHNARNAASFEERLRVFVQDPFHVRMEGRWRGVPVTFYGDVQTQHVAVFRRNGEFLTFMELKDAKLYHLWVDQQLGGTGGR